MQEPLPCETRFGNVAKNETSKFKANNHYRKNETRKSITHMRTERPTYLSGPLRFLSTKASGRAIQSIKQSCGGGCHKLR